MTHQLFEIGTGKFLPLSDAARDALPDDQRQAYTDVATAVAELAQADIVVAHEKEQLTADVETLAEVERTTPKYDASAAHTRLVKEMIASNRAARGF